MPTQLIDTARGLSAKISESAEQNEGLVTRETVDMLVDAGMYAALSPREVGGAELGVVDAIDLYAELSRADGSTGWCAMAGASAVAYFGAFGQDAFVERLYEHGTPVVAGQFAPNGVAVTSEHGWSVTGDYRFGSGIEHAEWVGAGVMTDGADGSDPQYLFTLVPADAAQLAGNWDVLGLKGTLSYDYRIEGAQISAEDTFDFFAPVRRRGGPVYDLGVLGFTAAGHAAFAIGVTRRALDEALAIAKATTRMGAPSALAESERFVHDLAVAESRFRASTCWVKQAFADAESACDEGSDEIDRLILTARQATVHLTRESADVVREVYLNAGTQALRDGPIQRCFRDIHAGTQHYMASPAVTVEWGQGLLA